MEKEAFTQSVHKKTSQALTSTETLDLQTVQLLHCEVWWVDQKSTSQYKQGVC
jgi:hypothetical protein